MLATKRKLPKPAAKPVPWLKRLGACHTAVAWAQQYGTIRSCWEECQNVEWLLWIVNKLELLNDRQLRLFACWCVRNTPLADGRVTWDLLTDARSKQAVEVAERFAEGRVTEEELTAARAAAMDARADAARAAARADARAAARAAQCNELRRLIGDPWEGREAC